MALGMTMDRLSNATLDRLPLAISRPGYDRSEMRTGIVHLGLGAFHRAHQAVYTDAVLASGDLRWGIAAASLRSVDTRDALAPQDGLYTLDIRGGGDLSSVIGSVGRILVAPENPAALLDVLCAPDTAIVSLTVTEKGYCRDAATGDLDEAHPDIPHDLTHPHAPRSALGFLMSAIVRRRSEGHGPFTVVCCDNLPANGQAVQRLLTRFAELRSPDLAAFVAGEIACPDTMVDRIVPATTAGDRARVSAALALDDAWPVVAEPFTQWVIADHFPAGRPAWDQAGAMFVADVRPFEAMKLRLLNASHSALAYFGYLAGVETVAEAMRDPGLARLAVRVMDSATATLPPLPGLDVEHYKRSLLARFRNPALHHRTWQIAMDGTQKLPQRILGTMSDRLAKGLPIDPQALVVAGWMRFASGVDEAGEPIEIRDPLAPMLARIAACAGPVAERLAPALLDLDVVFGALGKDDRVRRAVTAALARIYEVGVRRAVL